MQHCLRAGGRCDPDVTVRSITKSRVGSGDGILGTVWCVSFLHAAAMRKMVVSGDFAELNVFDLTSHANDLRLRASEGIAYSVAITGDSVCYTQGPDVYVYGLGGTRYSWTDQPSFQHVSQLALSSAGAEDDVLLSIQLSLDANPSMANVRSAEHGQTVSIHGKAHAGMTVSRARAYRRTIASTLRVCRTPRRANPSRLAGLAGCLAAPRRRCG